MFLVFEICVFKAFQYMSFYSCVVCDVLCMFDVCFFFFMFPICSLCMCRIQGRMEDGMERFKYFPKI
jgi:hypothetical protein